MASRPSLTAEAVADALLCAITQNGNDYVDIPLDLGAARRLLGKFYLALAQQYMALVASPEDVRRAFDDWVWRMGDVLQDSAADADVIERITTIELVWRAMKKADVSESLLSGGGCAMGALPSSSSSELITACEQDFVEKLTEAVIGLGLGAGRELAARARAIDAEDLGRA